MRTDESIKAERTKKYLTNYIAVFLPLFALLFTVFVYFTSDVYLQNINEFNYPYQTFIFGELLTALIPSLVIPAVVMFLPEKAVSFISAGIFGIEISVYAQYLFMNGPMNLLDGQRQIWEIDFWTIFINIMIWMLLIVFSIYFSFWKPVIMSKIIRYGSCFLLAMNAVSIILLLILSPAAPFTYDLMGMKSDEQYVLSSKGNVVVFVLDAVDNKFFEQILEEDPEAFEGFEDYTLYTDPCSVYDSTPSSMSQMFGGMHFDNTLTAKEWYNEAWHGERANEFFDRFHNAGYKVNGYSIDSDSNTHYYGKFDNLFSEESDNYADHVVIDKKKQYRGLNSVALYRAYPFILKSSVQVLVNDFEAMNIIEAGETFYYNDEFYEHMDFTLSGEDRSYFVIEHIFGSHPPCDDYIEETKFLLQIMREFNRQLKELGIYDDTAVIITSDHGQHNEELWIDSDVPVASIPIFMIKEKGAHKDEMAFSSAPIYHEDFQSTILKCAGLFNEETDPELFGPSIYDFDENSVRTRTWYDRQYNADYPSVPLPYSSRAWAGCNVYNKYTYTGNSHDLIEMVARGEITEVMPMTENIG